MKESDIVKAIMRYLKSLPNCFAWKEHGGMYGTAGIPDIIACINGKFYAFEVKTAIGKTTALQEATIRKITSCGGYAGIVGARQHHEQKNLRKGFDCFFCPDICSG